MFTVECGHTAGIEKYQRDKDVDRALLCEEKPELKSTDLDLVQPIEADDSEAEGDEKPDRQTKSDEAQIVLPVGAFGHWRALSL